MAHCCALTVTPREGARKGTFGSRLASDWRQFARSCCSEWGQRDLNLVRRCSVPGLPTVQTWRRRETIAEGRCSMRIGATREFSSPSRQLCVIMSRSVPGGAPLEGRWKRLPVEAAVCWGVLASSRLGVASYGQPNFCVRSHLVMARQHVLAAGRQDSSLIS